MEGEVTEGVVAGKGEVLAIQRTRGPTGWCPGLRQHVAGGSRVWQQQHLVRKIDLDSKLSLEELVQFPSSRKLLSPSGRVSMWPPILHHRLRSPSLGCMDLSAHHLLGLTVVLVPSTCSQPLLLLPMFAHSLASATAILFWQFFACLHAQSLQSCPTL